MPRAIAVAAKSMSTRSTAWMELIREDERSIGVHGPMSAERDPPPDEGHHGCDLQHEDDEEQRHLEPEHAVLQVVARALLESSERAREAGRDREQRGHAPRVVGG